MEKITITQSRHEELLKMEFAVDALKAYAKHQTGYLNNEVVNAILNATETKKAEPSNSVTFRSCTASNGDDF